MTAKEEGGEKQIRAVETEVYVHDDGHTESALCSGSAEESA